jgi:hypothetical protein
MKKIKDWVIWTGLTVFAVSIIFTFIVGGIYFKNFLNYKISVEKMVQETVIQMVEEDALKDDYK